MERFQQIAERYLKVNLNSSKEWMCACPFCDGANSLQFNIEKGLWTCFRCNEGGNAKRLVQKLGGSYTDPAVSTETIYASLDRLRLKERRDNGPRILDENYLLRFTGGPPHEYWTDTRGFTPRTVERWQLGYDPLTDRCTIPVRDHHGNLLGCIYRRLDNQLPRYSYPKGFDRLGYLFGSWKVADWGGTKASLVEGSTDTIGLDQADAHSLGQFGSFISPRQVRLIRELGLRELILFYDYDEAGRKATEQARTVLDGFILRRVTWDIDKYCWHEKLCGCRQHTWRDIATCKRKVRCRCRRQHNMDPGKLSGAEITRMIESARLVGRKEKEAWGTRRSAR